MHMRFNSFILNTLGHHQLCITIIYRLAFPADIGRKPVSPARGSRQRLHAGERYKPASEIDLVSLNMAAPVRSVRSGSRQFQDPESQWCLYL